MEIKACSQRLVSPEISNSTRDRFQIRHAKVYTPASSRTTQNDFAYCQYTTAISSFDLDSFMHDCLEHIRIWHHVSFNSESDSQTSNNQPLSGSQSRSTARKWKRTWLSSLQHANGKELGSRHCPFIAHDIVLYGSPLEPIKIRGMMGYGKQLFPSTEILE